MSTNTDDEILTRSQGPAMLVTLNRPAALNALSHNMILHLLAGLERWKNDASVESVIISGAGGKAFCAGGDIKQTWANRHEVAKNDHYFYDEYNLNRHLHDFSKPLVALMDGITMGGGWGVAGYCDYRIATENTRWAMPETGIGFFPDIGSSYSLLKAPGAMGMCLALTGMTIGPEDAFYGGFATHYIYAEAVPDFVQAVCGGEDIDSALIRFHRDPSVTGPLAQHQDVIDRCFRRENVAAIIDALSQETSEWAQSTLKLLQTRSPLGVSVTFARMKQAAGQAFEQIIEDDYVIARQFMRGNEFFEGVRAMLVDKDKSPKWEPKTFENVSETAVSRHFEPLPGRLGEGFKG
jgi:enoyl-CoA hydratase